MLALVHFPFRKSEFLTLATQAGRFAASPAHLPTLNVATTKATKEHSSLCSARPRIISSSNGLPTHQRIPSTEETYRTSARIRSPAIHRAICAFKPTRYWQGGESAMRKQSFCNGLKWSRRRGSNPHGTKYHWILSPARLPVPPLRGCSLTHSLYRLRGILLSLF